MCIKEYVRINDRSLWKKQKQEDDRRQFKKEKKRGRKGGGTEPRNEFSSHCHMAQKETNLWEGNRKESRLCGSGQALGVPEHPWKWEVCLSAFLVKHLTQVICPAEGLTSHHHDYYTAYVSSKKSILFLLFQDPHVNAFFQQCQKREKDMSQSPTSNFIRSCKVTWHTNSCSGLQDGNGQNRPLHFALSSKLQGNHSWRFLNTLSIPRRNYFFSQFLKGVCLYNGTVSKDQFLQNKNDWKSESIDSKLVN